MAEIKEVELFVALDGEGYWVVGSDPADAVSKFTDDYSLDGPLRIAKITVRMSLPVVVEADGVTIPDEDTTLHVVKGGTP